MKIGDLVYTASEQRCPKVLGIIIACDYANSDGTGPPEAGEMWFYRVKWVDTQRDSWYDMEEVERVDAAR